MAAAYGVDHPRPREARRMNSTSNFVIALLNNPSEKVVEGREGAPR